MNLFTLSSADVFRHGKQVLFDVSLSLEEGDHTAIIGPNGSGKSTLLSLFTRALSPVYKNPPSVMVMGKSLENIFDLKKQIGVVSESIEKEFYTPDITGENAVLSGFFGSTGTFRSQFPTPQQYARVRTVMEELSLSFLAFKPMKEMSAGERQKILLARALIHSPKVLVLDEPTNALDIVAVRDFSRLLRDLAKKGVTLFLITHHLHEVFPEISRVILMKKGRIAYDGKKEEILTSQNISDIFEEEVKVEKNGEYFFVPW
ncbi:MAG: ATP-binding cassette domain-containing protein [Candidatus Peregrinibacteria bacterium]